MIDVLNSRGIPIGTFANEIDSTCMETAEYKNILSNEDSHFFYVAVHDLILRLITKHQNQFSNLRLLDAGCGTGGLAKKLEKIGAVTPLDICDTAIDYARQRGLTPVQGSVENLPFDSEEFDIVTSVDVIYHKNVESDAEAIAEYHRVLKPGGFLVLRVPANKSLFSSHDKYVHTARRYQRTEVESLLKGAGFRVEQLSYCQFPLFFPAWLKARLDERRVTNQSVVGSEPDWINAIVKAILLVENRMLISDLRMPTGIGLIAVCRK